MAFIDTTNDWDFEATKVREGFEEKFGVFKTVITDAYGTESKGGDNSKGGAKYVNLEFELIDPETGEVLGKQNKQFYLTSGIEKGQKTTYTYKDKNNKEHTKKLPAWYQLGSIVAAIECLDTKDEHQKEKIKEILNRWLNEIVETQKDVFGEKRTVAAMPNFIKKPFYVAFTKKWDDYNEDWKAEFSEARCENIGKDELEEFIEKTNKAIAKAKIPKKKKEKKELSKEKKEKISSW